MAVCDQIAQYSPEEQESGPRWLVQLVAKQAKVEGFQVQQFTERFEEGLRQLGVWLRENKLKHHEEIVEGLENAPRTLISMFETQNIGKPLVKVAA